MCLSRSNSLILVLATLSGIWYSGANPTDDVNEAAIADTVVESDNPEVGRITNGINAHVDEFPSIVLLNNGRNYCGGSLIHPYWVLTAAHCFKDTRFLIASVGKYRFRTRKSGRYYRVEQFLRHPDYNTRSKANDIALVKLRKPAHGELMPFATNTSGNFEGQECKIAGWGRKHFRIPFTGDKLQKYHSKILTHGECKAVFKGLYRSTNICISGPGAACKGDSGGPLVCNGTLAGVTSYGKKMCALYPSVYTRVSEYYDWILSVIKPSEVTTAESV